MANGALISLLLMAVGGTLSSISSEECPISLILNLPRITNDEVSFAQTYADCVSVPWLPTTKQMEKRRATCANNLERTSRRISKRAVRWVNHIASQFPGCGTKLEIRRRGS